MKRLWTAFLISTLLFGAMHFLNLATYGISSFGGVFFQFLLAFFTGAMFLTSYLYTKSILVPIVFHYAYDTLGVAAIPNVDVNALTLIIDKQAGYPLMYYIIAILFVAYFMSGSRLRIVKQNLQEMCPSSFNRQS